MLDYVQWYYPPGDNYRADAATEAALQVQRSATMEAIIAPLRRYSGEDYGTDVDRWRKWLNRRGGTKGQSPEEEKQIEKGSRNEWHLNFEGRKRGRESILDTVLGKSLDWRDAAASSVNCRWICLPCAQSS